jgi:hypothetical protein
MIEEREASGSPATKVATVRLCSNLSKGLHAAAQPLTILRASLCPDNTDRMSKEELRELTARSTIEVERICALFSCLQELVSIESVMPEFEETSILPLLVDVIDGVNLMFEKDGMSLCSILPETVEPVVIDKERTLQALYGVLFVAHTISSSRDIIELIATSSANAVRIVLQNVTSPLSAMDAQSSLNMALAESAIRSQRAGLTWSLQPFSVQIEFQKSRSCFAQ